jgi:hypothetical protein
MSYPKKKKKKGFRTINVEGKNSVGISALVLTALFLTTAT